MSVEEIVRRALEEDVLCLAGGECAEVVAADQRGGAGRQPLVIDTPGVEQLEPAAQRVDGLAVVDAVDVAPPAGVRTGIETVAGRRQLQHGRVVGQIGIDRLRRQLALGVE